MCLFNTFTEYSDYRANEISSMEKTVNKNDELHGYQSGYFVTHTCSDEQVKMTQLVI